MMANLNWQPGMSLELVEKEAILQAFRFYRANKTTTASALGISIRTLDAKLEKYATDDVLLRKVDDERREQAREFGLRQRGITRNIEGRAIIPGSFEADVQQASSGVRVESVANTAAKSAMPVQERTEVQSVPSKQVAKSHSHKAR